MLPTCARHSSSLPCLTRELIQQPPQTLKNCYAGCKRKRSRQEGVMAAAASTTTVERPTAQHVNQHIREGHYEFPLVQLQVGQVFVEILYPGRP